MPKGKKHGVDEVISRLRETEVLMSQGPWQNGYAESFHNRLHDEFLAVEQLESLAAGSKLTNAWRDDYNHHRPHGSLGTSPRPSSRSAARFRSRVTLGYASPESSAPAGQRL